MSLAVFRAMPACLPTALPRAWALHGALHGLDSSHCASTAPSPRTLPFPYPPTEPVGRCTEAAGIPALVGRLVVGCAEWFVHFTCHPGDHSVPAVD